MLMTETSFSELVQFINTHPKWRQKLLKALFPDLDLVKAFQDLAESQQQLQQALLELTERVGHIEEDVSVLKEDVSVLKEDVSVLKEDVSVLKEDVSVLKEDVSVLKEDMGQVKHDVASIKGFNYESRIIQRAAAIFGRFMRQGHDARNEIGILLEEAEKNGLITEQEHDHVLALDLLWGGKQKGTKADIVLTIEVSWRAEENDITRAIARTEILRKMGLAALPVVAGLVWDEDMITFAREQKILFITDTTVDDLSWQNAF